MPISFILFALTGVVFLLQLFPVPGIFLMMLLAPAWSIVTLNLGFLIIPGDVWAGHLSRVWLLAPVLWFGGYTLAAVASHLEVIWLDARIGWNNVGKVVPFSAARNSLVIDVKGYSNSSVAQGLVSSYALPVAFERKPVSQGVSLLSWRLGGHGICQRTRSDVKLREVGIYSLRIYEGKKRVSGLCVYHAPEVPTLPPVTVSISKEEPPGSLASYALRRIAITDAAGQTIDLLAGNAAPLRWLPMPVMGCGLNSAAAAWECDAGFVRQRRRTLGADREFSLVPVIARGLGLRKSPASERRDAIEATPDAPLEAIAAAQVKREFASFDNLLAENPHKLSDPDFLRLAQHPEFLAPRADKMVDALQRSITGKPAHEASQLQRLIAVLSPADFNRVGPQLLRILDGEAKLKRRRLNSALLARVGDLGMAALPTLERYMNESNDYVVAGALLGICRIGAPAVAVAPKIVDTVLNDKRMKIVGYQAAFVALRRLGRADLADRIRSRFPFNQSESFKPWDNVTPDSPADVCVDYRKAEKNLVGR